MAGPVAQSRSCKNKVCVPNIAMCDDSSTTVFKTRFVYSSSVNQRQVDALMAKKSKKLNEHCNSAHTFQDRVVWGKNKTYNGRNNGDNN